MLNKSISAVTSSQINGVLSSNKVLATTTGGDVGGFNTTRGCFVGDSLCCPSRASKKARTSSGMGGLIQNDGPSSTFPGDGKNDRAPPVRMPLWDDDVTVLMSSGRWPAPLGSTSALTSGGSVGSGNNLHGLSVNSRERVGEKVASVVGPLLGCSG